ncbi:hypothetical protein KP509_32G073900 [Ceratopteris richardii]|uniref:Uncharacterized protein n=1 Tax=Ceratopteris richardii TaxID=49495 RepID=A0A8T2QWG9_CERRI|nr:hypothetical protein KP509_32G073900 [Ceratopteris richardii]
MDRVKKNEERERHKLRDRELKFSDCQEQCSYKDGAFHPCAPNMELRCLSRHTLDEGLTSVQWCIELCIGHAYIDFTMGVDIDKRSRERENSRQNIISDIISMARRLIVLVLRVAG